MNSLLHRSSGCEIGTALSIVSSRVGFDNQKLASRSRAELTAHRLVSKAPIRVLTETPLLRRGRPGSTNGSITFSIIFAGNLSRFRSSDIGTRQVATRNCGLTDGPDVSIRRRRLNDLQVLQKPKCSCHIWVPLMSAHSPK